MARLPTPSRGQWVDGGQRAPQAPDSPLSPLPQHPQLDGGGLTQLLAPSLPPHAQPPRLSRGCQDGAHKACITVVTMHRPQCQPWEALDVPPPGRTPKLFLCVQRTLCPSSAMDRASPVLCLVLEGPRHLLALNLASPLAPRVGLSSLPPTMPLGLQGTPPPTTCLQNLLPRSAESTSLPRLVGHL